VAISPAPRPAGHAQVARRPPRILVVDDEQILLDIFIEHFINSRYEVETAATGSDALVAVGRERPDVVLLDIKMPHMSGIQVLQEILKLDRSIRVIMVSGISDVETTAEAFRHGAFGFVPKPFDFRYLLHLIEASIDR
jgi:two-component system C4-dicarboxylate transport response regulator DctD